MGCHHVIEEGSDVVFSNYILPVVSNSVSKCNMQQKKFTKE